MINQTNGVIFLDSQHAYLGVNLSFRNDENLEVSAIECMRNVAEDWLSVSANKS